MSIKHHHSHLKKKRLQCGGVAPQRRQRQLAERLGTAQHAKARMARWFWRDRIG